ncbi:Histone-lysine N-methyltransferase set-1 [Holothuria leucospilota]|uniref:Histone-lysine N-methyltransferase set-1 n=1 Tax=Holothuria leucospilota TaxID=206669 RepID=A0A9Q0Y951_HOLLE|nr:Histone-lysine N-methyltransferase set-1 [Holothuria leucospilota]
MKEFSKEDFLLEYSGDLLTNEEGKQREKQYSEEDGSFLFFFLHNGKEKCIDATKERNRAGRMVNDSNRPNAKMRVVEVSGTPHLCLFAVQDIANGEELRYDYGVKDLPWRLKVRTILIK